MRRGSNCRAHQCATWFLAHGETMGARLRRPIHPVECAGKKLTGTERKGWKGLRNEHWVAPNGKGAAACAGLVQLSPDSDLRCCCRACSFYFSRALHRRSQEAVWALNIARRRHKSLIYGRQRQSIFLLQGPMRSLVRSSAAPMATFTLFTVRGRQVFSSRPVSRGEFSGCLFRSFPHFRQPSPISQFLGKGNNRRCHGRTLM